MRTKLHRLDPDDRLARAAEIWQAGQREPFSNVSRLAVVGFVTFTERQWKLLASLAASVANVLVTVPGGNSPTPDEVFDGIVQPAEVFTRFGQSPESTLEDRNCEPATRPAGLDHLTRTLFKTSAPTVAADAAGLNLIESAWPSRGSPTCRPVYTQSPGRGNSTGRDRSDGPRPRSYRCVRP